MIIRKFKIEDLQELIILFQSTVQTVCKNDYSPEQIQIWGASEIDGVAWATRYLNSYTYIVQDDSKILGFSNLTREGYIDMFYVHNQYQGLGVGKKLYYEIENKAKLLHLKSLNCDISLTAKPFFIKMGFKIDKIHINQYKGVDFINTKMSKLLL